MCVCVCVCKSSLHTVYAVQSKLCICSQKSYLAYVSPKVNSGKLGN